MEATVATKVGKSDKGLHSVEVKRRYNATPEKLYQALVSADAISKWFGPNDEMAVEAESDAVVGGTYRIVMSHQAGNQYTVGGRYTALEPFKFIEFTFQWEDEGMSDMGETTVSYSIEKIEGGSELTLFHGGFLAPEGAKGHSVGWNGGLWRLERLFDRSALQESSIILALNRKLYDNCLDGISDEDLKRRPSSETNNLLWIAGHVASTRSSIAAMLGLPLANEMEVFAKGLDNTKTYPTIDEVKAFFTKATGKLHEGLPLVSVKTLLGPAPAQFPINDSSLLGAIAFLAQHEAYHVGQMGMLRKFVGKEATSYS